MSAVNDKKKGSFDKETKKVQAKPQVEDPVAPLNIKRGSSFGGLLGLFLGLVVGFVATAIAYEHYEFRIERLHECEQVSAVLTQIGIHKPAPAPKAIDEKQLEKERLAEEFRKKRGHDVYFVKGEILYKFGNLFAKWEQALKRVKEDSYRFIEKAEILAQ